MSYFKRNTDLVKEVEKILANGQLSEDEKNCIQGLVDRYNSNTFELWADRGDFYAEAVSDMVNDTSFNADALAEKMSNDHPTLQQNFMRMCVKFIKKMAEKSCYDARNKSSVLMAKQMVSNMENDALPFI